MKPLMDQFFRKKKRKAEIYYQWCCPKCHHTLREMNPGTVTLPFNCPCCAMHNFKQPMVLGRFKDSGTELSLLLNPPVETSILGRITLP